MLFYFGLLIVILVIVLGLVSYKSLNKKTIDDTLKPNKLSRTIKRNARKKH
mgnify:FL=1